MKHIIFVMFIYFNLTLTPIIAQLKWDVVNDTITLTPNKIFAEGSVAVLNGKSGGAINFDGTIEVDMKEKTIFFNDGKNLFQFKNEDLANVSLNGYGTFSSDDLFKRFFSDSTLQHFRRLLYPNLDLNEITFSLSKRVEYGVENNALVLKNQKSLIGKLCYIDLDNIVILNDDGEIEKLQDGDFNFLETDGFKGFSCKAFYNYIFTYFEKKLKDNINNWNERMKQMDLESLIAFWGPFDNLINISQDKRMITWKKSSLAYYLNLSTLNTSRSFTRNNFLSNIISTSNSFFENISPFFLYGNSYRTSDISLYGNTSTVSSSLTIQSGKIVSKEEGFTFTIIQDSNNKIIQVYQENIFAEPQYGSPFRFISF